MAEIRDPKRFYYAMRSKYMREAKQIGHKLSLAISEEEDALYWEKYKKVIERWRALEIPEGIKPGNYTALQTKEFWKPEFNPEYIALTIQLRELCIQLNKAKTKQECHVLENEIRTLKKKRSSVTTWTGRQENNL